MTSPLNVVAIMKAKPGKEAQLKNLLQSALLGIPRALGHPFHEYLDSDSTLTWTLIPRQLGH
ncbi:hypothetical protein PSTH68_25200 [Pseudomonas syringae pv. theae]|uniref:hypothetical protein n=1 Tax=Pseudomonas syringae TaxID=317 RepID=UPI00235B47E1|nr:hypothetical protein [Pseudomonas syringae]MBL3832647.1 hypothetical protein [Pseudomonas syringae pv. theae]GKQ32881.1 hypothetical protein PSTH68_25200 [Pseudomonas syringae pv. theae]GKQ47960.1 hypothetical protein PSTH2693_22410 [Pseudomonas syringae pv. theae]